MSFRLKKKSTLAINLAALLPLTKPVSRYDTSRNEDYRVPISRLAQHTNLLYRTLFGNVRREPSISVYSRKTWPKLFITLQYFSFGRHTINVIHTKLRPHWSLNYDLYKRHSFSKQYFIFFPLKIQNKPFNKLFRTALFFQRFINVLLVCKSVKIM